MSQFCFNNDTTECTIVSSERRICVPSADFLLQHNVAQREHADRKSALRTGPCGTPCSNDNAANQTSPNINRECPNATSNTEAYGKEGIRIIPLSENIPLNTFALRASPLRQDCLDHQLSLDL